MRYLNDEELQISSRFLFLSMALVVIQQDIQLFKKGPFKIKELYLHPLEKMETAGINERKELKKIMQKKQLKVFTLTKNDSFSSFLFVCRGKEEKRNYFNPAIRKKVEVILQELMKKAIQQHDLHDVSAKTAAAYQVSNGIEQSFESD
ncbi:hypothetical protein [Virgibacillus halodenitrificans]|jgi:hypothetical protein|uniref:Uncharacterized protein n=1 Tax=Virgibacillus halodenitrificans TaxID=1482 RepID=A0AAC9IYF5_VIRHA|nr:hypothetical protein [Virgibacillus halodenitrificans]APC47464.1 hypothetical protein BME96_04450 [Virgibacillus halodenitrificans]MBD1221746.1 hypothetical protein [Virgibacillus halodenitrificans]WHX24724.1 hypothetical protein QNH47_11025 [Virgibacillus halodenitrificans]CDQ32278.1 hypothetical protein BN993_01689 [Virgibacillus halodenitrificans]